MSDKPEIQVGQTWITRSGHPVRILSLDGAGALRVVGQYLHTEALGLWLFDGLSEDRLEYLAPMTVKRHVSLYSNGSYFEAKDEGVYCGNWRRISEPVTIEFTLLPGECAE